MSLAITATFNEENGTVSLAATSDFNHVYGDYTLVRSDAVGTAAVRTQADLDFSSLALAVVDHEPAINSLVNYTIVADGETAEASVWTSSERTWLKFPILPQYSLEMSPMSASYEGMWEPNDVVFRPLDREDPIVSFGTFGTRSGTFEVYVNTYAAALELAAAYRRIRVALLQVPDPVQASMYHVVSRVRVRKMSPRSTAWLVTGEYLEVARPTGPVLGTLGWSYADTTALALTYAETAVTFPTYGDRFVGS